MPNDKISKITLPDGTTYDIQDTTYSAGTGLSLSDTVINHSNSVTAQTTQAIYPITIDAQGHIGSYGNAVSIPTKTSDLTNDSGFITGMYIASYGSSTYAEVLAAYKVNKVVYCRASSNSNPGTGSQNRMAFLAYVNNSTTPTEFEFQYYRSVSSHSDSQQGDQVYVYKLNSSGTWSVITREAYTKVKAGTNMSSSYSNGVITLNATMPTVPSAATATPLMDGTAAVGSSTKYALEDHVHPTDTSRAAAGLGISSASAGQVVKISTVDSSGVPTAYTSSEEVVDITHCCYAETLSSAGWYRIMTFTNDNSTYNQGATGIEVDFHIGRRRTTSREEIHNIKMLCLYNNVKFINETSATFDTSYFHIDKIRYTYSSTNGYVDVHVIAECPRIRADFSVHCEPTFLSQFMANDFVAVADSPSGETVLSEYSFSANGSFVAESTTFSKFSISGDSNITIPFANGQKALIVLTGAGSVNKELVIVNTASNGTVTHVAVMSNSNYTYTATAGNLKIANAVSTATMGMIIYF